MVQGLGDPGTPGGQREVAGPSAWGPRFFPGNAGGQKPRGRSWPADCSWACGPAGPLSPHPPPCRDPGIRTPAPASPDWRMSSEGKAPGVPFVPRQALAHSCVRRLRPDGKPDPPPCPGGCPTLLRTCECVAFCGRVTAGVTESRAVRHEVTLGGCVTTGPAERRRGVRGRARARPRSQAGQRDEGRQLLPRGFTGEEKQEPRQDCGRRASSL